MNHGQALTKKGHSFKCLLGKKVYAAQDRSTTWSHSKVPETCLGMHAFKSA